MRKILLIFKDEKKITKNQEFWKDKLSLKFNVEMIFLTDLLHHTNLKIIKFINEKILSDKIDFTIFEGDHVDIIDSTFIDLITDETIKGLFLGDDMEWHEVNRVTASKCDFVFTSCPISKLKFNEFGVNTLFVPVEANGNIWKDYNLTKNIDILFFGREKKIRNQFFSHLDKEGINILKVDPYMEISNTNLKLAKLINQSKIILNFSSSKKSPRFWSRYNSYEYSYYFKGRVYMASFCNSLCITEYDPAASLIFSEEELPQFNDMNECVNLLKSFLGDEVKLKKFTKKFYDKGQQYLDINYIEKIEKFLFKTKKVIKYKSNLDIWYIFIHVKQLYRSRYKSNNFLSFIKQFTENFILFKNNKILDIFIFNIFSIIFFLRFLPFLPYKIFKSIFKKN
jgi:hypothetical protein